MVSTELLSDDPTRNTVKETLKNEERFIKCFVKNHVIGF